NTKQPGDVTLRRRRVDDDSARDPRRERRLRAEVGPGAQLGEAQPVARLDVHVHVVYGDDLRPGPAQRQEISGRMVEIDPILVELAGQGELNPYHVGPT